VIQDDALGKGVTLQICVFRCAASAQHTDAQIDTEISAY